MEKNAEIRWLFFDIGSTLLDEEAAYALRFREMATAAAVDVEAVRETALSFWKKGQKGDHAAAAYFGLALPLWHSEAEKPYADAKATLQTLHRHYQIGIIANQKPGAKERLARHGLLEHVDLLISSGAEGVSKPDPRIFMLALERSGCRPEQAVMIGDRVDNDILPAKALGMHTVWIRQGFGQYGDIPTEADITVDNLTELLPIFATRKTP